MGMYIIGEKPDRCGVCPCFHAENPMYCQAVKAAVQKPRIVRPYANGRPDWCPLIEVPEPHGRLIDADALHYSRIRIAHNDGTIGGYHSVVMSAEIKDAPIIIPASEEGELQKLKQAISYFYERYKAEEEMK